MRTIQSFFAVKYKSGIYHHFYRIAWIVKECANKEEEVHKVRVILDDKGNYYTWHDYKSDTFDFTNRDIRGVEICFPYGSKIEEKHNRGKIKRCTVGFIKEVRNFNEECND